MLYPHCVLLAFNLPVCSSISRQMQIAFLNIEMKAKRLNCYRLVLSNSNERNEQRLAFRMSLIKNCCSTLFVRKYGINYLVQLTPTDDDDVLGLLIVF